MFTSKFNRLAMIPLFFLAGCEVVELDSVGKPIIPMSAEEVASIKNMEPKDISDKFWVSIVNEAKSSAISFSELLIKESEKSYFTNITGVIESVDTSSKPALLKVKQGNESIAIQLGPIIKGNAIRDASSRLLPFDQFKNQIQFAKLSKELNKKAIGALTIPDANMVNQNISVLAALTIKNGQIQDIVPIEINKTSE